MTVDWTAAAGLRRYGSIILAGGLNPHNAADAVRRARPDAIDVNSGVEQAPGIKDHHKLKMLFKTVEEFRRERTESQHNPFHAA